jgi:hypothetical protein
MAGAIVVCLTSSFVVMLTVCLLMKSVKFHSRFVIEMYQSTFVMKCNALWLVVFVQYIYKLLISWCFQTVLIHKLHTQMLLVHSRYKLYYGIHQNYFQKYKKEDTVYYHSIGKDRRRSQCPDFFRQFGVKG